MKNSLWFLYQTIPGRCVLRVLVHPWLSGLCGAFLDTGISRVLIPFFVRSAHIRVEDYEVKGIRSFNDFFCRRIRSGLRPVDPDPEKLIAPCDGMLRVWPIRDGMVLPVKESTYTLSSLLRSQSLAARFEGGLCLVFRLGVENYHRYCYAQSGIKSRNIFIPGILHTVQPVALAAEPVFTENSREFTLIRTDAFGTVLQMEVGAMLVGRICNHQSGEAAVQRGEEKGYFCYGGSTVILLLQRDKALVDTRFMEASLKGLEVPVRLGEAIGRSPEQIP